MVDNSSDVFSLLKRVCSLQEERAYTYKLFEEGHKIYLGTAPDYDFATFRELVREVTQEFKRISEGVMDIERKLRVHCGAEQLASFVAALQEEEKAKLELVARLQLARQNALESPDQQGYQDDIKAMKQQLNKVVERINEHLEEIKYEMNDL